MTINDLINQVKNGELTPETAAQMAKQNNLGYAVQYFSASMAQDFEALSSIRSAYKSLNAAPTAPVAVETVKCSCGHTVSRVMVMSSSRGTCCADCYDRMSD